MEHLEKMAAAANQVLLTASALGLLVVTWLGLRVWKQQLKGTAEWELSRRLLRQVYSVRDRIRQGRSMLMTGGEVEAAIASGNAQGKEEKVDGLAAGYQKRWERIQAALSELDLENLEAEVLWGRTALDAVVPLRDCARDFFIALQQYLSWRTERRPYPREEHERDVEAVVFPIPGADGVDAFERRLQKAVETAEAFVRPRLKR
jgi:hypothetical protein